MKTNQFDNTINNNNPVRIRDPIGLAGVKNNNSAQFSYTRHTTQSRREDNTSASRAVLGAATAS